MWLIVRTDHTCTSYRLGPRHVFSFFLFFFFFLILHRQISSKDVEHASNMYTDPTQGSHNYNMDLFLELPKNSVRYTQLWMSLLLAICFIWLHETIMSPLGHWTIWVTCCKKRVFKDLCRCHRAKRRIAGQGPANPSFGMTPNIELYSVVFTNYISYIVSVVP